MTTDKKVWIVASLAVATLLTVGSASAQEVVLGTDQVVDLGSTDASMMADPMMVDGECCGTRTFDRCFDCPVCDQYWVRGGALWLRRQSANVGLATVFDPTVSVVPQIENLDQFRFAYEPGWTVTLGAALDCFTAAEINYFQITNQYGLQTQYSTVGTATVNSGYGNTLPNLLMPGFPGPLTTTISNYTSDVYNFEMNVRRYFAPWTSALLGFRYFRLEESFTATDVLGYTVLPAPAALPVATAFNKSTNDLFGVQLGIDVDYPVTDWFEADLRSKAGVFVNWVRNRVNQNYNLGFPLDDGGARAFARNSPDLSFILDCAAAGTIHLTRNLSVRGGYMIMWTTGLALAPEQPQPIASLPFQAVNPDFRGEDRSNVFWYGPFAELELRWGTCN